MEKLHRFLYARDCVYMDLSDPVISCFSCFDHIWDMMSTCTQKNLVIHISVYTINTTIPVIPEDACDVVEKSEEK